MATSASRAVWMMSSSSSGINGMSVNNTQYTLHTTILIHICLQCLDIFSWVTGRASSLLKSLEPANNHGSLSDYWRAPWKNQISSTTMKLRKSLVKPVTWQNISICLVLPPETVMHDAFNVILWTSADICVVVHDDLGWKNWTTRYNCRFSATSLALWVIFVCRKCPPIYASCMTISGGRTEKHVVIGFGELAAVD